MEYQILMGIPDMHDLWTYLYNGNKSDTLNAQEEELFQKWGNALKRLSQNPFHPGLRTHEIEVLSRKYGLKVWQSYLENRNSSARRMYWVYGPDQSQITIVGLEPHPDTSHKNSYNRIKLSGLPDESSDR